MASGNNYPPRETGKSKGKNKASQTIEHTTSFAGHTTLMPSAPVHFPMPTSSMPSAPAPGIHSALPLPTAPVYFSTLSQGMHPMPHFPLPSYPIISPGGPPPVPPPTSIPPASNPSSSGSSTPNSPSSDTSTPARTQRQDPGDAAYYDYIGRLIIVPEMLEFYPSSEAIQVVLESVDAFYHDAWKTWGDVPCHVRVQMWNYFRRKCSWHPQFNAQIESNFNYIAADYIADSVRYGYA